MFLKKYKKLIILLFLIISFAISANVILAQPDVGFEYATALELGTRDLRAIVVSIINIFLGFLGIIAIIVVLYGGFMYMTSAGDPEKIDQAKKILINGAIGLAIILSSWAIVLFIFRAFDIGGGGDVIDVPEPSVGPGALGSGIIQSHYPGRSQRDVARNTKIAITFKEEMDDTTICADDPCNSSELMDANIIIEDDEGTVLSASEILVSTNDSKTFTFSPVNYLGNAMNNTWYTVSLTDDIKKANGDKAFPYAISGTGYYWQFEVSTNVDLTSPQVESVIPYPDNSADDYGATGAAQAFGSITVVSQPETYVAAENGDNNITPIIGLINASVSGDYAGSEDETITIQLLAGETTATVDWSDLDENDRDALNPAPVDSIGRTIPLGSGLTLIIEPGYTDDAALNRWEFDATAVVEADIFRVGNTNYKFVSSGASGNQIDVGGDVNATAQNIASKIDQQSSIEATAIGNVITITAIIYGSAGNSIAIIVDDVRLTSVNMSGGQDAGTTQECVGGACDQPRNVVVQINFNEAVDPVNATGEVLIDGGGTIGEVLDIASFDKILVSVDIDGTKNYVAGSWTISNQYRTIEFLTFDKCGVNSCGDDIYCLPTDSNNEPVTDLTLGNISVEINTAALKHCDDHPECTDGLFNQCVLDVDVGDTICEESSGKNSPQADDPALGVIDMANNSLDGNRDDESWGPQSYYNDNTGVATDGDSFLWSFWVNSKIDLIPPKIEDIHPDIFGTIDLEDPIEIKFSKLMMSSSLKPDSGYESGKDHLSVVDNSVNPVGYWINKENIDDNLPLDDVPDKTRAYINHTSFTSSTNYSAKAAEGVKDLYQNCFVPARDDGTIIGSDCSYLNIDSGWSCCNGELVEGDDCP